MKSIFATLLLFVTVTVTAQQRYDLSFGEFHELKVAMRLPTDPLKS